MVDGVRVGVCDGDAPMMLSERELLVTAEPGAFDSIATSVLVPDCAFAGTVSDAMPFELPEDDENDTVVDVRIEEPVERVRTRGDESAFAVQETATVLPATADNGAESVRVGVAHVAEYVQPPNKQNHPSVVEPEQVEATVHLPEAHWAVQRQPFVVTLAVADAASAASIKSRIPANEELLGEGG